MDNKKIAISIFLFLVFTYNVVRSIDTTSAKNSGTIYTKVNNIKNNKGQLLINLFNTEKAFPTKPEMAYKILKSSITADSMTIKFEDIPYGTYAISVVHDKNMDGKLNMRFFPYPKMKEGVGTSNDAKGKMGPPKFKDAKFELESSTKTIIIKMNY